MTTQKRLLKIYNLKNESMDRYMNSKIIDKDQALII